MRVPERLVVVDGINLELGASPWRDLATEDLRRFGHAVLRVATVDGQDVITGVMDPAAVGPAEADLWTSTLAEIDDEHALVAFHHALSRVMGRRLGCCRGEGCQIIGNRREAVRPNPFNVTPAAPSFFDRLFGGSPLAALFVDVARERRRA